ncbi:hypothetical protein A3A14_02600 [Candidatus Daviesbacteria bacterium RIFCSPLOWO2_01_FULL_43_38]|uniref:Carbonic anhydrase n=3 Tax=Candidatus Daviesiibacteriota TaxID=1752718 RepID=A0A1F5K417_9BACT|nr:MAG: hypothetical protein UV33_C0009G0008 [Candidatus Daviesbacteria bacterium GW2011_GWA1_42_6]KKS71083.1 MAG: hypothetical protein UV41_C0006G0035 [Candidatus Daviesbacteria bacterium GW2011_GWA2_42_7]OGE19962.1 MAG: hypothetical protein A2874_00520 [Candidatus Daviesbacteria bacterium RIFCSPHIGHO2_01_FULL_43_17]OGE35712.1 MAG: hypothetical protein A3E45_00205 [Candidatus Daviesbacteria bacterium RIFCSPHIGHO2_12_FULL_43_11]OGE63400.1 MAG: hypothetical protein A3A14_02600 [Candidatus Davies
MIGHSCDAAIVTCIDFRFQPFINKWIADNFQPRTYDRIAFAGGVFNLDFLMQQIEISHRLHHIKRVVLINHEDCGAYGEEGTDEKHAEDLKNTATRIKENSPEMEVDSYYLHLDGNFEKI